MNRHDSMFGLLNSSITYQIADDVWMANKHTVAATNSNQSPCWPKMTLAGRWANHHHCLPLPNFVPWIEWWERERMALLLHLCIIIIWRSIYRPRVNNNFVLASRWHGGESSGRDNEPANNPRGQTRSTCLNLDGWICMSSVKFPMSKGLSKWRRKTPHETLISLGLTFMRDRW